MILLFILFLILLNIYFKRKGYAYNIFPIIVIILILYAGLKYNYSYDYKNYLINFNEINVFNDVLQTSYEKGYSFFVLLFKFLGLGFNTFLLFISFVSIGLKSKAIKQLSVMPEVSLLIYFLLFYVFNDVEQIRHGISLGLCFYSLNFILREDKKSKLLSISLIALAILFHTSAILFIPVILIKDKRLKNKSYIYLLIASFLLSLINYYDVLIYLNETFFHSAYLFNKLSLYSNEMSTPFNLSILIKLVTISIFFFFAFDKSSKFHRLLFNIYFIGILFSAALNSIPVLAARGTIYMRYAEILIIPIYISKIYKNTNKKFLHYFILTALFVYYLITFYKIILDPTYFQYNSI